MTVRQQHDDLSLEDGVNDREALTKAQSDDPDVGPVLLVIGRWPTRVLAARQLVVPASMRHDFIREAHTVFTGRHYESERTQDQVQRLWYWHG